VLCAVRLRSASHLSIGVLPSVVYLSVIVKPHGGDLSLLGLSSHEKMKKIMEINMNETSYVLVCSAA
jgi:hypothetical protein